MNKMKRNLLAAIMFLSLFYASALSAEIFSQYSDKYENVETADISTFSLPEKSRAIIKKYFPSIQLELGEVPEPYHHLGREKALS